MRTCTNETVSRFFFSMQDKVKQVYAILFRFATEKRVRNHVRLIHAPRNKPCLICGQLFKSNFNLRFHMETHGTEKNFRCDQCGNFYKQYKALSKHKRLKGHWSNFIAHCSSSAECVQCKFHCTFIPISWSFFVTFSSTLYDDKNQQWIISYWFIF